MKKLKIGVLGGSRGMAMIRILAALGEAEVSAVCDSNPEMLEKTRLLAAEAGFRPAVFTDFEDFFACDMDAAVLANYANEHAPLAARLLRSGRHVLSEVLPFATMAEAAELVDAAEESGKVYAYAENYSYMKGPFEMWRRAANGDLGEIRYAEGEYVHSWAEMWHNGTRGDPMHWRNRMYSTFYCSHSLGPVLTVTGRRPVSVTGFETPRNALRDQKPYWVQSAGGMELVTLDNGAVVKSLHGGLLREPAGIRYRFFGDRGSMETGTLRDDELSVYLEDDVPGIGVRESYQAQNFILGELAQRVGGHGGCDFYPTYFFLQKILGRADGLRYSIDVYTAADIGLCGILAYRSILNGNLPVAVPDFRKRGQRDAWRNDHACTDPAVAGEQLLPVTPSGDPKIPAEAYRADHEKWLAAQK